MKRRTKLEIHTVKLLLESLIKSLNHKPLQKLEQKCYIPYSPILSISGSIFGTPISSKYLSGLNVGKKGIKYFKRTEIAVELILNLVCHCSKNNLTLVCELSSISTFCANGGTGGSCGGGGVCGV